MNHKDEIINKLKELAQQTALLEPSAEQRASILHQGFEFTQNYFSELPHLKAFHQKQVAPLEINNEKFEFSTLLDIYRRQVIENGINASSGKHLGYIPGGGIFMAAIADYIAAISNPFASIVYASPGAAAIENAVIDWLKKIFSFPSSAVGSLNSGGSISTLIALAAARDAHQIAGEKIKKSTVYFSAQLHHSTQKALRILGLGDLQLRAIQCNDNHSLDLNHLQNQIQQDLSMGFSPFLLIATAGTTDTGAIDALDEMAKIANRHAMWYHVDAAYGGFFILSSKKDKFKGIEKADSLIVDPHKSLFLPYGVGAVLIKDKRAVLQSNYYTAAYMQDGWDDESTLSPANISPELTKHFRGLRVWLPLQYHGIEPFVACLEEKLLLIQYCRMGLKDLGFELGPEPSLSITYFWYPFKQDTDNYNQLLMNYIHQDGSVFLSSTRISDRFVIRVAILAFRTKMEVVDEMLMMIQKALLQVKEKYQIL